MPDLTLYHFASCPYCVRVRRFLDAESVQLAQKDILRDPVARQELASGGGSTQVPCLRIDDGTSTKWMYESLDIIDYLRGNLGALRAG